MNNPYLKLTLANIAAEKIAVNKIITNSKEIINEGGYVSNWKGEAIATKEDCIKMCDEGIKHAQILLQLLEQAYAANLSIIN